MNEDQKSQSRVARSTPAEVQSRSSFIPHPSSFWMPGLVAAAYVLALTLAFPPFNQAWTVLVFLVPFVKWAFTAPRWRVYLPAAWAAGWGSWFCIMIWLRHIDPPFGWVGL